MPGILKKPLSFRGQQEASPSLALSRFGEKPFLSKSELKKNSIRTTLNECQDISELKRSCRIKPCYYYYYDDDYYSCCYYYYYDDDYYYYCYYSVCGYPSCLFLLIIEGFLLAACSPIQLVADLWLLPALMHRMANLEGHEQKHSEFLSASRVQAALHKALGIHRAAVGRLARSIALYSPMAFCPIRPGIYRQAALRPRGPFGMIHRTCQIDAAPFQKCTMGSPT